MDSVHNSITPSNKISDSGTQVTHKIETNEHCSILFKRKQLPWYLNHTKIQQRNKIPEKNILMNIEAKILDKILANQI